MSADGDDLVAIARSMFDRGLTPGTTGNVSVRTDRGLLITPTGRCMGRLATEDLAEVTMAGEPLTAAAPSKEVNLHIAVYRRMPHARAVVHLHSPAAVALSCLAGIEPDDALAGLSAYHAMKVGRLGRVAFHPPGSAQLATAVDEALGNAHALILDNHGTLVGGTELEAAADVAEQVEHTARIFFMLDGRAVNRSAVGGASN